jgi:hypothetical protein
MTISTSYFKVYTIEWEKICKIPIKRMKVVLR